MHSTTTTITTPQRTLIESALYEIASVTIALRALRNVHMDEGAHDVVARGSLARIQLLSESISDILDCPSEDQYEKFFKVVNCAAPTSVALGEATAQRSSL